MSARQSKASKARSALQAQHRELAVRVGQAPDYRVKELKARLVETIVERETLAGQVDDLLYLHSSSTRTVTNLRQQVRDLKESRDLNRTTLWLLITGTVAYHGLRYFGGI